MVLNKDADMMAITEYGQFYIWVYKLTGPPPKAGVQLPPGSGSFKLVDGYPKKLPRALCREQIESAVDDSSNRPPYKATTSHGSPAIIKSVDMTPPISQIITYNSHNSQTVHSLALRLVPREKLNTKPYPRPLPYGNAVPPYGEKTESEKYFVMSLDHDGLPIIGGHPVIVYDQTILPPQPPQPKHNPDGSIKYENDPDYDGYYPDEVYNPGTSPPNVTRCLMEKDYYKSLPMSGMQADLTIESPTKGGCLVPQSSSVVTNPSTLYVCKLASCLS